MKAILKWSVFFFTHYLNDVNMLNAAQATSNPGIFNYGSFTKKLINPCNKKTLLKASVKTM
jgi:hypothetical protein